MSLHCHESSDSPQLNVLIGVHCSPVDSLKRLVQFLYDFLRGLFNTIRMLKRNNRSKNIAKDRIFTNVMRVLNKVVIKDEQGTIKSSNVCCSR